MGGGGAKIRWPLDLHYPLANFLQVFSPGLCRLFDLAQSQTIAKADKFFAAGYLATERTFRGEDHSDDWRYLDVVVIKCDGARKVYASALRSRPR